MNDSLRLIVLKSSKEFGNLVDQHLCEINGRNESYIVPITESRFSNGEGKVVIDSTIREKDVYILADVYNYSCTYKMYGFENHMGPDEHFADIKRVISAMKHQYSRLSVVMPVLYSSRQHRRKGRESLDCAVALQELERLGVDNIITFDAHDPNVQNAIPSSSFENFYPTDTVLRSFFDNEKNLFCEELLVIAPDSGAAERARFYADVLGCNIGMFYKRRDLTKVVDGKCPIVAHEYMGADLTGKTAIVVDDMIASGGSIIEVAEELKRRNAKNVYLISTFSLFTSGIEIFDLAYKNGLFNKVYTTNLSYIPENYKNRSWLEVVDCSKQLSVIINALNNKNSISALLNQSKTLSKKMFYDKKRG